MLSGATLSISNVVGYPIEGFVSSDDLMVFPVRYDRVGTTQHVEILGD